MNHRKYLFAFIVAALLWLSACSAGGAATKVRNGVQLEAGDMILKAQFTAANTVHISKWLRGTTPDSTSLVVIQTTLPDLSLGISQTDDAVAVRSPELCVIISKTDGAVTFLAPDGEVILSEKGEAEFAPAFVKDEKDFSFRQRFTLSADEAIYGLGQHQYGSMNYRGRTVKLVQTNTDAVTPFLISTKKYDILWDNTARKLVIGKREGSFPGMIIERDFRNERALLNRGTPRSETPPDYSAETAGRRGTG